MDSEHGRVPRTPKTRRERAGVRKQGVGEPQRGRRFSQTLRRARGRHERRPWGHSAPPSSPAPPTHTAAAPASNAADRSPRGAGATHRGASTETRGCVVWPPGEGARHVEMHVPRMSVPVRPTTEQPKSFSGKERSLETLENAKRLPAKPEDISAKRENTRARGAQTKGTSVPTDVQPGERKAKSKQKPPEPVSAG